MAAQLGTWFEELRQELDSSAVADSVEACEEELSQFNRQRVTTVVAYESTQAEGEQLLQQLRSACRILPRPTSTTTRLTFVISALMRVRRSPHDATPPLLSVHCHPWP